jgi:hypothetical protein
MKEISELSDWDQGTVRGLRSLAQKGEFTDTEAAQTIAWIRNGRPAEDED